MRRTRGSIGGEQERRATAAPGAGATLVKVELLADGAVFASVTSSPAQGFWQSTEAPEGAHVLTARAVDSSGASTTSPGVSVTVDNAGTSGTGGGGGGGCASAGSGLSGLLGLLALRRRRRVT